jgi:alpha-L-fucosidase
MPEEMIRIRSLGSSAGLAGRKIENITILGANPPLEWKQENDALVIRCPEKMELKSAVCFKIDFQ